MGLKVSERVYDSKTIWELRKTLSLFKKIQSKPCFTSSMLLLMTKAFFL
ncbi:hypothetical protein [Prosthecochloris sp. SCSIO W1103]|nr:hypothetical protein [Prosthecochloris sp. SCSIO W1103]UZJ38147.1 hypothetical protein OO005_02800 [Prosthecochloris sp. SCSIO W1103]